MYFDNFQHINIKTGWMHICGCGLCVFTTHDSDREYSCLMKTSFPNLTVNKEWQQNVFAIRSLIAGLVVNYRCVFYDIPIVVSKMAWKCLDRPKIMNLQHRWFNTFPFTYFTFPNSYFTLNRFIVQVDPVKEIHNNQRENQV